MKARLALAGASVLALLVSMLIVVQPAQAQSGGFHIQGTNLVDANGNNFVIRGVAHPHVWFQGETASFAEISDLGANLVRVVLGSGVRWGPNSASDVSNVINMCKQNELICMLEVHDTTGFGEDGAAGTLQQAVSYWTSIQSALEGEEAYVLINIGNEPYGNQNAGAWTQATINAIQGMRSAGFDHTLVVDAPNWGQDWEGIMQSTAPQVAAADSQDNTLFSIHMYEVYGQASAITNYMNAFQSMGLPLIVGEFGHQHNGQNVDEDTILSQAQQRGLGYVAWSYSGNSGGAEQLDLTNNFNPNSLTSWGQRVFNGQNGIAQTAQRASVFDGTTPPTSAPPTSEPPTSEPPTSEPPTSEPPQTGGSCDVDYSASNWGGAPGFTASVTVTNTGSSSLNGWELAFDFTAGQQLDAGWSANWDQSGSTVTATNLGWNGNLAPGQSTQIGFNGSMTSVGNNPSPSTFTLNGSTCS